MQNNIQLTDGIELSRYEKERQEQRFLAYVKGCAERRAVKAQAGK